MVQNLFINNVRLINAAVIASLLGLSGGLYYWGDVDPLPAPLPWAAFLNGLAYHEVIFILLAIPTVYAAVTFRVRGALVSSAAATAVIFPHAMLFTSYPDPFFRLFSFAMISMLLGGLIGMILNGREELQEQHRSLEQFASETLRSQETEKRFLARELHDETAQQLVDILHEIDEVREGASEDGAQLVGSLSVLRCSVETVLEGTRRFMQGLRPPQLDELGLGPSLRWMCTQMSEETGITIAAEIPAELPRMANHVELALYRMAQEGLTNARRHAQVSHIGLRLQVQGKTLRAVIEDDGAGFIPTAPQQLAREGKFGLLGVYERARLVGGTASIRSSPGRGTRVTIEVPVGEDG